MSGPAVAKMVDSGVSERDSQVAAAQQLQGLCETLSRKVSTYTRRFVGETDAIGEEVQSLIMSIATAEKATTDDSALYHLAQARAILRGRGPGDDLRRFTQPRISGLLLLLLGSKTNLVTFRKDQSLAMKEEFYSFRDRGVWIMLAFSVAIHLGASKPNYRLSPPLQTAFQCYSAWLAYFYLALALRECVLAINGSHIRRWWIYHHYWSSACSMGLLALPASSPTVHKFCRHFMMWSFFQAVVMLLQNRYQRRRMYTRVALGHNSAMDVVSGESSGTQGQLLLLYPLLFVLQVWQLMIGANVAMMTYPAMLNKEGWLDQEESESDLRGMRGLFGTGLIFCFLAVMNFVNTVATIWDKETSRHRRRSAHKQNPAKAK